VTDNTPPSLTIGTATAQPGKIVTGWFEAIPMPTGGMDCFPLMIAQGADPAGPVLWLTTGIHGDEHTGLIAIHNLITPELVESMRGTLVAVLALSPAGMRHRSRTAVYHGGDPNRAFPRPVPQEPISRESRPISGLEAAYKRLYQAISDSRPAALLDLHNASIGSIPFAFRDPVFYGKRHGMGMTRLEAETLQAQVGGILDALGFTVINEFVSDTYVSRSLHRSVSGSILNGVKIPAATIELGSWMHVDPGVVGACCTGIRNVMRWAGMLDGPLEPIEGIPVIKPGYSVRRMIHPYAPSAGLVHHLVRPGEFFERGQPLARLTNVFGDPIGRDWGLLRAKQDGFVIAWHHGVLRYQGDAIMIIAVRDRGNLVEPFPE
jgi:predicted deacylase